jgi:hypothetical protein
MVDHNRQARNVGLGYSDEVDIPDTMITATADWRNSTTNYAMIGQEVAMNANPAKLIDLEQERRIGAMIALAALMEDNFWGPPVAVDDTVTPWGINTWLQKNATEGFNGGMPSGYTTLGVSSVTYPRWRNWTFLYTNVSPEDFVRKMSKAAQFVDFKPPVEGVPNLSTGNNWAFYTNYGVIGPLQELLRASNENLGADINVYAGQVIFNRAPVQWVPRLESDTTNPIYGLNWGDFKTYVLAGWWLRESYVPQVPGQHTVSATHVDCTYQWVLRNRRTSFVGATGTTYPG